MKNPIYLIILLALGLVFTSYKWATSSKTVVETTSGNAVYENIMTRTSVRSYSDRQIAKATVDTLLQAAMAAPTAGNKQPWRIVVVNKRELLDSIASDFQYMTMAKEASLAVVMCGDTTATFPGAGKEFWVQDVSAASENLLLAAHSMGLGAVWCGVYPQPERVEQFSKLLTLPSNIIPLSCICIGYPKGDNTPKDKWKPENVHYNSWNGE